MSTLQLDLDEPLLSLLRQGDQAPAETVREMVTLELYRRGSISSGKAAELLGMTRMEFIRYAGRLGIPFFRMSEDEWAGEMETVRQIVGERRDTRPDHLEQQPTDRPDADRTA